jgi:hypothetical protein
VRGLWKLILGELYRLSSLCVLGNSFARVRPENRRRGFEGEKYIIIRGGKIMQRLSPVNILIRKWGKSFFNVCISVDISRAAVQTL